MKKLLRIVVVLLASVAPCLAGITYTAVTRSADAKGTMVPDSKIKGWASGGSGKVLFEGDQNPMMPSGSYLITKDGAKTLFLVDPVAKTFTKIDVQQMLGATGVLMQGMRGMMKMEFETPKIEKLLEEKGGLIAGLPTRHYRYRTTYTVTTRLMGTRKTTTKTEEDIWATTQVMDAAMGIWLKKEPPKTGDEQMDKMIQAEMGKVEGFPLKRITVITIIDAQGGEQKSRNEMEVIHLKRVPIPSSTFEVPTGYREVRMGTPKEQDPHEMEEQ